MAPGSSKDQSPAAAAAGGGGAEEASGPSNKTETTAKPKDTDSAPQAQSSSTPDKTTPPSDPLFWIPQRHGPDASVTFVSTRDIQETTDVIPHASQLRFGITEQSTTPLTPQIDATGTLLGFHTAKPNPVLYYIDEESKVYDHLPERIVLEQSARVPSDVRQMDKTTSVRMGMWAEFGNDELRDYWYVDREHRLWGGMYPGMLVLDDKTPWPANYQMVLQDTWPSEELPRGVPTNLKNLLACERSRLLRAQKQRQQQRAQHRAQQRAQQQQQQPTTAQPAAQQAITQLPAIQQAPRQQQKQQRQQVAAQRPDIQEVIAQLPPSLQQNKAVLDMLRRPPTRSLNGAPATLETIEPSLRSYLTCPLAPGEFLDPNTATADQIDEMIRRIRVVERAGINKPTAQRGQGWLGVFQDTQRAMEQCHQYERYYTRAEKEETSFADSAFVAQQGRLWKEEKRRLFNPPGGP